MKKLSIKLNYQEVIGIDHWLEDVIENYDATDYMSKCILAVLINWRTGKLQPKTLWHFTDKSSFKLDVPTAMALAHVIFTDGPPIQQYIGNRLNMIASEIDQHFQ